MKSIPWVIAAFIIPAASGWAATSVTVKQGGGGDFTTIQSAIDSGASTVTIIDSGHYVENLEIGNPSTGGPAVILTSTKTGAERPIITPSATKTYINSRRTSGGAGFGVFANGSSISNLVIEAQPDFADGAMMVVANNVLIENCLFRIATNTTATLAAMNPLLFFGQQGDGSNTLPGVTPGGPDSNGCIVRNCEFMGAASDAVPLEPTADNQGYLGSKSSTLGTGQGSGYIRVDILTDTGEDVLITLEGCYFHHDLDYGIFPTDLNFGGGSLNIAVKKCRFDANGKFQIRGRGANVFAEDSIFTRCNQTRNGDTENSAVAINNNDGHSPSGAVKNCLFVNCGSGNAQRAYYGGVNNNDAVLMSVDHCSFVDCGSGVDAGSGGGSPMLSVSNSIFHQIGDNVPPSVDSQGTTLTNGNPELIGGICQAWTNGLANFGAFKWSAVFNRFNWNNGALIVITNCMVGTVDTEDTRTWDQALSDNTVLGSRLFAGYDTNFVGATSVTRAIPLFVNQDPDSPNPFQLMLSSPGQGLGANLAPVLEPKLSLAQAGNQITISWSMPIWIKNYVLKSSPSLDAPSWSPVGGVVNNSVTVSTGSGNQYFAVMKQ